jgi:hypothetical protein
MTSGKGYSPLADAAERLSAVPDGPGIEAAAMAIGTQMMVVRDAVR